METHQDRGHATSNTICEVPLMNAWANADEFWGVRHRRGFCHSAHLSVLLTFPSETRACPFQDCRPAAEMKTCVQGRLHTSVKQNKEIPGREPHRYARWPHGGRMAFAVNGAGATGNPSAMDRRAFDLNITPYNKDSVYKCKAQGKLCLLYIEAEFPDSAAKPSHTGKCVKNCAKAPVERAERRAAD